MSQKSTYGIPRGSPMEKESPVRHIECKKGSATLHGTLNETKFKAALQKFVENLERAGILDSELEKARAKEEAPAPTGTK